MNFVTSTSSKKKKKVGNQPSNPHSHQTMDKLKEIQERRNLWMNHAKNNNDNSRDEETVIARSHNFIPQKPSALPSSSSSTLPPVQSSNSSKYYSTSPASFQGNISAHTDQLLQQLTFKLTHHITENIKKEQLNSQLQEKDVCNTIVSRIDEFVSNELSSFLCPICYELMTPPQRLPILLFPCGHTFCQTCLEQHFARHSSSRSNVNRTCPYCRENTESKAINQSLKELIDQFVSQKSKIENRQGHIDDLFVSQKSNKSSRPSTSLTVSSFDGRSESQFSSSSSPARPLTEDRSKKSRSYYHQQLKSHEMRYIIMRNELDELLLEQDSITKRKQKIEFASNHLAEERDKVASKIQLLLEEQQLINQHLENQQKKLEEANETERVSKEKTSIIENTLDNLQKEMDKLKMLSQGIDLDG